MGNSKIVVHLSGGLGNQLFQFMAGLALAESTSKSLAINTNLYKDSMIRKQNHPNYQSKRRLEIMEFSEVASIKRDRWLTPRDGRFERLLAQFTEGTRRKFGVASEKSFLDGEWINPEEIQRLIGHFMSSKYFLKTTSRQRFQNLTNPMSLWASQISKRISARESIAVHVRLGDYLQQKDIFIPSEVYFLNGINYLREVFRGDAKIFLFTDDPQLLAKKFPLLHKMVEVVNQPPHVTTAENLLLLSKCSAFVCSNSTYSWWGAHMSGVSNSLIVRPSLFYASNREAEANLSLWEVDSIGLNPLTGE